MIQTQGISSRSRRGPWLAGLAAVGLWIVAPVLAGAQQVQQRPSSPTAKSSGSGGSKSSASRGGSSRSSGGSRSSAGSSNRGGSSRGTAGRGGSSRGGTSGGSGTASRGGSSRSGTANRGSGSRPSTRGSVPNRKWRDTIDNRATSGQSGHRGDSNTPTKYRDRKWHPDNNKRTHRPYRRHHNGHHYYPYYGGYPYYGAYPFSRVYGYHGRYNPFWNFSYYGNYRYPAPWYPHQAYEGRELGGLDLNVRPKTAEVYLNGNFVGEAGNFDGYPRYLWLEDGVYEVIFYLDGYQTVVREVEVVTGVVIDVQEKMQPGQSVLPDELSSIQPAEDERVEVGTEWWREVSAQTAPPGLEPAGSPVIDARAKPGRIRLTVAPADASVYLDGHFVGTGRDLVGGDAAALLVDAGEHVLEIVHPRHESRKVEINVDAGEEIEVDLGLGEEKSAAL